MTERTIEQIKADIEALKAESELTSAALTSIPSAYSQNNREEYDNSLALAGVVIGFGVFVLLCITYLIRRDKQIETLLRPFGTILIIIGALFLIVAGYSEKQIAPVIGLLGTIAGYVLGRDSAVKQKEAGGSATSSH